MATNRRPSIISPFSEAVALAALSGFAYLEAYAFERGFASVFGIPSELIDLRWTALISAGSGVLLAAAAMGLLYFLPERPPEPRLRHRAFRMLLVGGVSMLGMLVAFGWAQWRLLLVAYSLAAVVLILIESIGFFILERRRARKGATRVKSESDNDDSMMVVAGLRVSIWVVGALFLMVGGILSAFASGQGKALRMQDFLVTPDIHPQAVLRIYSDKIVTVELDRQTHTLNPIYRILPLTDSARVFTVERLTGVVPPCRPLNVPAVAVPKLVNFLRANVDPEAAAREDRCARYRQLMDTSGAKKKEQTADSASKAKAKPK